MEGAVGQYAAEGGDAPAPTNEPAAWEDTQDRESTLRRGDSVGFSTTDSNAQAGESQAPVSHIGYEQGEGYGYGYAPPGPQPSQSNDQTIADAHSVPVADETDAYRSDAQPLHDGGIAATFDAHDASYQASAYQQRYHRDDGTAAEDDAAAAAAANATSEDQNDHRFDGSPRPLCAICSVNTVYHLLVPCGHACMCSACHAEQLGRMAEGSSAGLMCPLCLSAVDVSGDATAAKDEWGRPVTEAHFHCNGSEHGSSSGGGGGLSIATTLSRLHHGFPCADGSVASWCGGLAPDEDLLTLKFLQIGTDVTGLLTRFVRTTGASASASAAAGSANGNDGSGGASSPRLNAGSGALAADATSSSNGPSRPGRVSNTTGLARSRRKSSVGSVESAAARMRRNSSVTSAGPPIVEGDNDVGGAGVMQVDPYQQQAMPPEDATDFSSVRPGRASLGGKAVSISVVPKDHNSVPYDLPVALLPVGQCMPGWVNGGTGLASPDGAGGAGNSSDSNDPSIDSDELWTSLNGSYIYEGEACSGTWRLYRVAVTASLYYVHAPTGEATHTLVLIACNKYPLCNSAVSHLTSRAVAYYDPSLQAATRGTALPRSRRSCVRGQLTPLPARAVATRMRGWGLTGRQTGHGCSPHRRRGGEPD